MSLAQQLQGQATGNSGPSAAQLQLGQATSANNAQAASAAASAPGINPALGARLALDNQASNNQTAANQSAQTKVQEQLSAQQQLGSVLGQAATGGTNVAQVGTGQTSAGTGEMGTAAGAQNTQNTGVIQNQLGTEGLNEQAALANQQASFQKQSQDIGQSEFNAQAQNSMMGGIMGAVGGAASMAAGFSKGGEVGKPAPMKSIAEQIAHHMMAHGHAMNFSEGGDVPEQQVTDEMVRNEPDTKKKAELEAKRQQQMNEAAMSADAGMPVQKKASGGPIQFVADPNANANGSFDSGLGKVGAGIGALGSDAIKAAKTPSNGISASDVAAAGQAAMAADPNAMPGSQAPSLSSGVAPMSMDPSMATPVAGAGPNLNFAPLAYAIGGKVPGKAKVSGNSPKNDTVPTMLSPGEVVLPKTVSHDPEAAAQFVAKIMKSKKKKAGGKLSEAMGA